MPERVTSRVPEYSREESVVLLFLLCFMLFCFLLFIFVKFCDEFNNYILKACLFAEQKARRNRQDIDGPFIELLTEFDQADGVFLRRQDEFVSGRNAIEPPDDGLQVIDAVDMMIAVSQL